MHIIYLEILLTQRSIGRVREDCRKVSREILDSTGGANSGPNFRPLEIFRETEDGQRTRLIFVILAEWAEEHGVKLEFIPRRNRQRMRLSNVLTGHTVC